jgi:serine/threonine protein kinase
MGMDRSQNRPVAIKIIDLIAFNRHRNSVPSIEEEIETLKILSETPDAQYMTQYYDSFIHTFKGTPSQFIISEYVAGRTLRERLDRVHHISRENVSALFYQLLLGLKHIHTQGYAHRDIKPDNIMMTAGHRIKYIDFGFACLAQCRVEPCRNLCQGHPGSPLYTPPHYYDPIDHHSGERDLERAQAHDMWSLGMTMWVMINPPYYFPFDAYAGGDYFPIKKIIRNIRRGRIHPSNYGGDFADRRLNLFVESLLITDWEARPTIETAIQLFTDQVLTQVSEVFV